jgi:hypothetical protein
MYLQHIVTFGQHRQAGAAAHGKQAVNAPGVGGTHGDGRTRCERRMAIDAAVVGGARRCPLAAMSR